MTDVLLPFGLGAIPDDPDERDYPIEALYAAEGVDRLDGAALPTSYTAPGMPPVLDQGSTPQCVAYSSAAMKVWQDKRDQLVFFDFDEARFFALIGGTSAGAQVRWAMERMAGFGYPEQGGDHQADHRIAAYYAVPASYDELRAAILAFGPVVVSTPWYHAWFRPNAAGVLVAPDTEAGGHAIVAYGWDARGLRLRNSWGSDWGIGGDCWMPAAYVSGTRGGWKCADVIDHPVPYVHMIASTVEGLRVRTRPTTAAPQIGHLDKGRYAPTLRLERYGGKYTGPTGAARTDWLEIRFGTRTGWLARTYTRLVR